MNRQDTLVAFKILSLNIQHRDKGEEDRASVDSPYEIEALCQSLCLARLDIVASIEKLKHAGLLMAGRSYPLQANSYALMGLAKFAYRYLFPVKPGESKLGMATAHGAHPMNKRLFSAGNRIPVWPTPSGIVEGYSIDPIHPMVPRAVTHDHVLYELFVLLDSLRLGGARERGVASDLLAEMLQIPTGWIGRNPFP